jgi:RNase H-fold protein (predicted Holliday junction resolvase)
MTRLVLALDVGTKRIGVAIGDAQDKLAIPRPALKRAAGKALDAVIQTLELEQIATPSCWTSAR